MSNTERIEGHYRRFIILEEFKQRLVQVGFKIMQSIESDGLAKFGEDDPVVIRIHAIKT